MSNQETAEFQRSVEKVVARLVKLNKNDTVELQNWLRLDKLVLVQNAEEMGLPDRGRTWEALTQPDGTFEHIVFFLQGLSPQEATELLIKEALPVIRRNLDSPERFLREKENASAPAARIAHQEPSGKIKRFSIWAHTGDTQLKYLKSVEHKWEIGGFLLGPIWVAIKKGPLLLAIIILAVAIAPLFIFGVNIFTIIWVLVLWTVNSRSHVGLQAMRLKSMGHERLGDVSAVSHEAAQAQFKRSKA